MPPRALFTCVRYQCVEEDLDHSLQFFPIQSMEIVVIHDNSAVDIQLSKAPIDASNCDNKKHDP